MIFSRDTILKKIENKLITITNFDSKSLEEASYSLKAGSFFDEIKGTWVPISSFGFQIDPGNFYLVKTQEKIKLSPEIACLVFTTGSLAQKGLDVVQSSSFCNPKTDSEITLEVVNHSRQSATLKLGQTVAKAIFVEVI
jgi:deoxycytidine triphosphate deaminase